MWEGDDGPLGPEGLHYYDTTVIHTTPPSNERSSPKQLEERKITEKCNLYGPKMTDAFFVVIPLRALGGLHKNTTQLIKRLSHRSGRPKQELLCELSLMLQKYNGAPSVAETRSWGGRY
jgi:hypothetical protein